MNPADTGQSPTGAMTREALLDLMRPVDEAVREWPRKTGRAARNRVLDAVRARGVSYQSWDEATWAEVSRTAGPARLHIAALGHLLGGHHRLHHTAGINQLHRLADLLFGPGATEPALREVEQTLQFLADLPTPAGVAGRQRGPRRPPQCRKPSPGRPHRRSRAPTGGRLRQNRWLAQPTSRPHQDLPRARGKGHHPSPAAQQREQGRPRSDMLSTVPPEWAEWALRWRKFSTHEPGTIRTMFSVILIAGRWAAEKHPDVIAPDQWTRDMAAEYIADTMHATVGQWAGHNRNRSRFGQPISPRRPGSAHRQHPRASSATSSNGNGSNRASTHAA